MRNPIDMLLSGLWNVGRVAMTFACEMFLWFLLTGFVWLVGLMPGVVPAFLWWLVKVSLLVGATAFLVVLAVVGWRRYGNDFMYWLAGKINREAGVAQEASYHDYAQTIMFAKLPSKDAS